MILSKIVSFSLSKLLKEKGFNEPCRFVHDTWNNIIDWIENDDGEHQNSHKNASIYYSAPTIDEVKWWLYEKHGIWISIDFEKEVSWFYNIKIITESGGNIVDNFKSPSEAYQAAIKYCLEKLI